MGQSGMCTCYSFEEKCHGWHTVLCNLTKGHCALRINVCLLAAPRCLQEVHARSLRERWEKMASFSKIHGMEKGGSNPCLHENSGTCDPRKWPLVYLVPNVLQCSTPVSVTHDRVCGVCKLRRDKIRQRHLEAFFKLIIFLKNHTLFLNHVLAMFEWQRIFSIRQWWILMMSFDGCFTSALCKIKKLVMPNSGSRLSTLRDESSVFHSGVFTPNQFHRGLALPRYYFTGPQVILTCSQY